MESNGKSGGALKPFFLGAPRKINKQQLLFSSMIVYFWLAECFFHRLHNSLCNTIVLGSWIVFRLSISCFVTQYIVVFNVTWSRSNKPSFNMFLTERK